MKNTPLKIGLSALLSFSISACSGGGDSKQELAKTESSTDAGGGAKGVEKEAGAGGEANGAGGATSDGADSEMSTSSEESKDETAGEQSAPPPDNDSAGSMDAGTALLAGDASLAEVIVAQDVPLPGGGFIEVGEGAGGELEILCGTEPCACSDGLDNDGDGVTDGQDGECTGPFDHDEATFSTGIPGDNRDPNWQDCFFDGNSGAGDDGCRYHTDCLTPGVVPKKGGSCEVSQECKDFCEPLTPPGCDCFGCCAVPSAGPDVFVLVSESCSLDKLGDEQACPPCEQTELCANECGECELCVGRTLDDLPAKCFEQGPPPPGMGGGPPMGSGGSPPAGAGGSPSGAGGGPATGGSPPSTEPPPANVCDGGLQACLQSSECEGLTTCTFGCCVPIVIFQ